MKTEKPKQPPAGKRVNPGDVVEEASQQSFPASDPPSHHSQKRSGPHRPAGEKPSPAAGTGPSRH